jgi:hypothetical protein
MSYRKFTLTSFCTNFGITSAFLPVLHNIQAQEPTPFLKTELAENLRFPMLTEKAKSEHIIAPVLREMCRRNPHNLTLFSGYELSVDKKRGLNGYCDFLFTRTSVPIEVSAPMICLVEAKNENIENGIGQCAAEMLAAHIFNERAGKPLPAIHGCVTSAYDWLFLRLEGDTLLIDTRRYALANLPELLGALQTVIDFYKNSSE